MPEACAGGSDVRDPLRTDYQAEYFPKKSSGPLIGADLQAELGCAIRRGCRRHALRCRPRQRRKFLALHAELGALVQQAAVQVPSRRPLPAVQCVSSFASGPWHQQHGISQKGCCALHAELKCTCAAGCSTGPLSKTPAGGTALADDVRIAVHHVCVLPGSHRQDCFAASPMQAPWQGFD